MGTNKSVWVAAKKQTIAVLREILVKSGLRRCEIAELLSVREDCVSKWGTRNPPCASTCLRLEDLLGVDIVAELVTKTDAPYFWDRFETFLRNIRCSKRIAKKFVVLKRWRERQDRTCFPSPQEMRSFYTYFGNAQGFAEVLTAWYPYRYCENIKAERVHSKASCSTHQVAKPNKDSQCAVAPKDEVPVKLEVPMDGTKEHPMTFYIHLDRVKSFVLEHGWSYTPNDLELYTSMVAAYAYQFFYGDSCDVLPRHLPTLSSEGGSYYYMSEDPTVGSCQIKSLKDFDFGGYLRARGVIPVITFDKEQDTMFRNLQ